MISSVSLAAMTEYWPSFSLIIDVPVDKSLSFNSCPVTNFDYVLGIHYPALSFVNFSIF